MTHDEQLLAEMLKMNRFLEQILSVLKEIRNGLAGVDYL